MFKILYSLILLVASASLFSCQKKCDHGNIHFNLSGFDSTELSRVVVKKYQKGTGFITALTNVEYQNKAQIECSAVYDWILEFPLAGKTYTIANIQYKNDDNPDSGGIPGGGELDACNDGINYSINNMIASSPTTYEMGHYPVIEIKK